MQAISMFITKSADCSSPSWLACMDISITIWSSMLSTFLAFSSAFSKTSSSSAGSVSSAAFVSASASAGASASASVCTGLADALSPSALPHAVADNTSIPARSSVKTRFFMILYFPFLSVSGFTFTASCFCIPLQGNGCVL